MEVVSIISIRSWLRNNQATLLPILDKIDKYIWWIGLVSIGFVTVFATVIEKSIFFTVIALLLFTPVLLGYYIKSRNVFIVSLFTLFGLPLSLATYLLILIISLVPQIFTNQIFTYYYLGGIPVMMIATFLIFIRKESSLDKVKVALEYNNAIFVILLFILFIVSNSTSDLTKLLPLVSEETLNGKSISDLKELVSLFFQIASGPFIIGNTIIKSLVEHITYRRNIAQNSEVQVQIE